VIAGLFGAHLALSGTDLLRDLFQGVIIFGNF